MPEHDETDALGCSIIGCGKPATCGVRVGGSVLIYPRCDDHAHERKPKRDRWGVEDKVVDGESK